MAKAGARSMSAGRARTQARAEKRPDPARRSAAPSPRKNGQLSGTARMDAAGTSRSTKERTAVRRDGMVSDSGGARPRPIDLPHRVERLPDPLRRAAVPEGPLPAAGPEVLEPGEARLCGGKEISVSDPVHGVGGGGPPHPRGLHLRP